MNEKIKAKFEKAKELAKKHGLLIVTAVLAAVATGIAVKNHGHVSDEDPDAWHPIKVHPELVEQMKQGQILKVRITPGSVGGVSGSYLQVTSRDEFPDVTDETFDASS